MALGRMGGVRGGKARAAKLTPEQRTEHGLRRCALEEGLSSFSLQLRLGGRETPRYVIRKISLKRKWYLV